MGRIKYQVKSRRKISIEGFIRIYTNLTIIEKKAQYVLQIARTNENSFSKSSARNFGLYHPTIKPTQLIQKRSNVRDQQLTKGNFQGRIKGNF